MAFQLRSSAFPPHTQIPQQHTGDGADWSPPLEWTSPPEGTESFALICEDPDAPRKEPWVHWVLFNLPADCHQLEMGIAPERVLPGGIRQGRNDFGNVGYGGPAPPPGKPHRYFFRLFALDCSLELPAGATKAQLLKAMEGHVLGQAELIGTYQR